MQGHQEKAYPAGFDYWNTSPHLKHRAIYLELVHLLRQAFSYISSRDLPLTLLEIGAGDGPFVEPALAWGFNVTATEMSHPAIEGLEDKYGANPAFKAVYDSDGSLQELGIEKFSVILFGSVLHHIPDYEEAIKNAVSKHLTNGGVLLTFQDPLWYPTLGTLTRVFSEGAYITWRLTQGNIARGLHTKARRIRGVYDESNVSDMSEYHVVRNGVNHEAIIQLLNSAFTEVRLDRYWSTQASIWQYLGQKMGLSKEFSIIASGFLGTFQGDDGWK